MPATDITSTSVAVQIHKATPVGRWEVVDVAFGAVPNEDLVIPHSLTPSASEQVHYQVVRAATPGTIYEPMDDGTAKTGNRNYIVLRSDTANWRGRLLLSIFKQDAIGVGEFI